MKRPFNLHFAGSALSDENLAQLFNPVVRTQYANNMVFRAPVNQQEALLRAIEALRSSDKDDAVAAPIAPAPVHG